MASDHDLVTQGRQLWAKATSGVEQHLSRERDKTFERTDGGNMTKRDDIVENLVRASASGIGLLSEVAHHRREKKSATDTKQEHVTFSRREEQEEGKEEVQGEVDHLRRFPEAIWELDAIQKDMAGQDIDEQGPGVPNKAASETNSESPKDSINLATAFLNRHPATATGNTPGNTRARKLSMPVVLPQRRPKTRVRGFIRAYAPILADVGINQATFLDFIDAFNVSLVPNPYLNAINLAGFADMIVPDPALVAFGIVLGVVVEGIMEAQSRFKSNTFLERLNDDFFSSRHGLVCFVATWKPDTDGREVAVNLDGKMLDVVDAGSRWEPSRWTTDDAADQMKTTPAAEKERRADRFRDKMGRWMKANDGSCEWSEPAPLVFPVSKAGGKKKNSLDRAEIWLDEYLDRRARVDWVDENPDHMVASSLPRPEFKSRYADPSHPAASGDVVAFVTGGKWQYKRKTKVEAEDNEVCSSEDRTATRKAVDDGHGKRVEDKRTMDGMVLTEGGLELETLVSQDKAGQQVEGGFNESMTDGSPKPIGLVTKAEFKRELKENKKRHKKMKETERKQEEQKEKDCKKEKQRLKEEEKKRTKMEKKMKQNGRERRPEEGTKPKSDEVIKGLFQKVRPQAQLLSTQ